MFKRFLKFLKGDEAEQVEERFEGSYLDHLLEEVRPAVETHLDDCPEHDPVLLVVVEVLQTTMRNAWAPGLREPLVDSSTPGVQPPPPPTTVGDASEADATNELDIVDEGIALEDTEGDEELLVRSDADLDDAFVESDEDDTGEDQAQQDDAEESPSEDSDAEGTEGPQSDAAEDDESSLEDEDSEADESAADEEADVEKDDSYEDEGADVGDADEAEDDQAESEDPKKSVEHDVDGAHLASDEAVALDSDDVLEESPADESNETGSSRITEEINVAEIREEAAREDTQDITVEVDRNLVEKAAELPRVDNEEVLQAGRVFFKLLLDNDQLPTDLQLSVGETMLARDLLLGYFVGDTGFDGKAKKLLSMVETKFGEGLFSQAKILLQLFQTDESTRVNNDRNLFYEDMILRLGIRRRSPLTEEQSESFAEFGNGSLEEENLRDFLAWLDLECLVKFRVRMRDPEAESTWHGIADQSSRQAAANLFKAFMPPARWRGVELYPDIPVVEQIRAHIGHDTAQKYILSQLKTAYFILRAVGDTGLEVYLDDFFDWTEKTFDINGTRLMPQLYNRSMMDVDPMDHILAQLYQEHFELRVLDIIDELDDDDIDSAFSAAMERFLESDLGEVAPGYYDLGAFVFDEIFEMPYPATEFASKIHRLT